VRSATASWGVALLIKIVGTLPLHAFFAFRERERETGERGRLVTIRGADGRADIAKPAGRFQRSDRAMPGSPVITDDSLCRVGISLIRGTASNTSVQFSVITNSPTLSQHRDRKG